MSTPEASRERNFMPFAILAHAEGIPLDEPVTQLSHQQQILFLDLLPSDLSRKFYDETISHSRFTLRDVLTLPQSSLEHMLVVDSRDVGNKITLQK